MNIFLSNACKITVGIMLAINLTIVFLGVAFRYIINQPLGWVYEIAVFLMMWSAFLGSVSLVRDKGHVALGFLVNYLPTFLQKTVKLVMGVAVIIFLCIVINSSYEMISGLLKAKSAYLRIPMIWVYISVPLGMFLIILQQIEIILSDTFNLNT
jgi:TRAP-type C4-dicarboxylate transport system permease small subunit